MESQTLMTSSSSKQHNRPPIICMFSGHGSHYAQMGKDLFATNAVFRETIERAEAVFQRILGRSLIKELYYTCPSEEAVFDELLITHPAIAAVEYATFTVLLEQGIVPDMVLGSSAGEYAAAVAAGILELEDALELMIEQAKIIHTYCPPGNMITVLDSPAIYDTCHDLSLHTTIAGINFSQNFVISCTHDKLPLVINALRSRNIPYHKLNVAYAFHSPGIEAAKNACEYYHSQIILNKPRMPYFSCLSPHKLESLDQEHLWRVLREPIYFQNTLRLIEQQGPSIFLDCGPSGTLATFIKYSLDPGSHSSYFPILSQFRQSAVHLQKIKDFLKDRNST